ncbi:MAG: inositol oxygenase family protein [Planctomycetota bacterium]|nr:inositol oxygenase family protein [Planctomycetota bacterium]
MSGIEGQGQDGAPLERLDDWEDFVANRYPEGDSTASGRRKRSGEAFRDYRAEARAGVKEFYKLNHTHQTLEFVEAKKEQYLKLDHKSMGVWEAIELLDTLVDDSDPDTELSQLEHLLQTAEAIRKDGHPRWLILTGLIHDLGKLLCIFGEPQWAVVGDTFPVGCRFSSRVVFPEFFELNPDSHDERYQTRAGIYEEGCGLDRVHLSWGHDEYLYQVVKDHLPTEALYPIRYHSFYAGHREGAYDHLMDDRDREMFQWVRTFNPYDLYSKDENPPPVDELRPFYEELVEEYLPGRLSW